MATPSEMHVVAICQIVIQNNTCDYYQNVGIVVYGVENEQDAGLVTLTNNIVSGSYYCGLALQAGWRLSAVPLFFKPVVIKPRRNWKYER